VEALNTQLDRDKQSVHELQAHRVRLVDVDEAVAEGTKRLEELHEKLEARVEGMSRLLDEYVDGTDGLFEEARQMTDAQINEHSNQVAKLLETSLHPISAYLNTMGVKADQARADLDGLGTAVPRLAEDLRALEQRLEATDCKHGGREDQLATEVATLSEAIKHQAETTNRLDSEFSTALAESSKDLGERLGTQRSDLKGLETALEVVRQTDLSGLSEELKTLERKVAQWVHAHLLPAKVSEARLHSLEARINEEMNARLSLETAMKSGKPGRELAITGPQGALSALPQLLPPGGGDSGPVTARTTASSGPLSARKTRNYMRSL
jgi:polyhydroxyalkanoate synthesis regulator phasin